MINPMVKPTQNTPQGGKYPDITPGMYDAQLTEFGDWTEGIDKNGNAYNRVSMKLKLIGGEFADRVIYESLFINANTPDWVLGNFLACFDDTGEAVPASEFSKFVGRTGKITTKNDVVQKTITDSNTGMDKVVNNTYPKVKNYIAISRLNTPAPSATKSPWDN